MSESFKHAAAFLHKNSTNKTLLILVKRLVSESWINMNLKTLVRQLSWS